MSSYADAKCVGVLSDTHGRLDSAAARALEGVDLIVHAGDVGSERILFELQAIAPVVAVQGNMDGFFASWPLAPTAWVNVAGRRIFVTHRFDLSAGRAPGGADVVIAGHTHQSKIAWLGSTLFVNPGSASRGRSADGRSTVALVSFAADPLSAEIVELSSL
ncbi:MAG: metallophosphoesterase [Coriobacteriia bacterium]|nr:metallophosphoesterase [Coriobacteriia bacterium]